MSNLWEWILNLVGTFTVIGSAAALFRDSVAKFFLKTIEHSFEKRLESFKGEMRDNEKELADIRSFLVSARREHDAAFHAKRREAAEILLRARNILSQLSVLVEYMKILKIEELVKHPDNLKIVNFIDILVKPFNVEGKLKLLGEIDMMLPRLYLSEQSLRAFDAYEAIVRSAAIMMKYFSIPISDKRIPDQSGYVSKLIIELIPNSKVDFERYGDGFAYNWAAYFHDEILRLLRQEISGADNQSRAAESIECVASESRKIHFNVRSAARATGLPETLIKTDEMASGNSSIV